MDLALLVYELRAAGVKSLAIELSTDADTLQPYGPERATLAPGATEPTEPEPPKDPKLCRAQGCGEEAGGIFGGIARHLCRAHAMQQAGVKA